jgi:hypothetical protein
MGSNRRLATSNVALMPPARPAPPGPLWMATLPPHVSRRRLARGELMRALREGTPLPEGASILHVGQADARPDFDDEDETVPSSGARPRRAILAHAVPSRGGPQPSSHSLPSSGSLSSGSFASASYAGASSSSDTLARGPLASSSAYAAGMSPLAQPSSQPFASQEETSPMNATPSPGRGSKEGER